jgi:signal transduction histidine kinase
MKLTLLHKGLLLVSIPLCFEITIFGALLNMQDQIELETARINRNKKITDEINGVVHDVIAISDSFEASPSDAFRERGIVERIIAIRSKMLNVVERFKQIRLLAQDDPILLAKLATCSRNMLVARADLMDFGRQIQESPSDKDMSHTLNYYRKKISRDFHDILESGILELGEISKRGTDDVTSRKIRERIRLLLKCALGFSVLFALFCATMFSKQLASRLSQVGENADKLAKGEPLAAPLGGTDEVAELDNHLHYAADLIEASKRMKQEVTAMITHDLKTPLQSVRSYLEMLESGLFGELNEQGTRLLATTESASKHMVGLIDSVLQLEKMRTGNIQLQRALVEVAPIMDKCLDSVHAFAESKKITIVTDYTSDHCDVSGDAFWLQEVFVNILSNGLKYAPEKSTLSITTRKSGRNVEIAIADQGPGISEEEQKLIFERFHRVQATANISGTGLGLPIAKELVELHNGSIKVESVIGKGSTFIISLPIWRPA